ncbi:MAG TPA: hypothetical protein PK640_14395 [Verrucomicrobiota bacterium]|nr:hypothetical protein [Verrucomicrobiota bacterium]
MFDLLFIVVGVILLAIGLYLNRRYWTRGFRLWLLLRALPLTIFFLLMLAVFWTTWTRAFR